MESFGNNLIFRNRPWNRPRKVFYSWKEPNKEPVKVLNPKKGTKEETGVGSWLWLSLKRLIEIFLKKPQMSIPNSTFQIFSKLFDSVDLTSHLIFVKIYLTGSLCFYGFHGQKMPKKIQNLFHTILDNPTNKKKAPEKKK